MAHRDVTTGRVPPGQTLTCKFPTVGERAPAPRALDLGAWRLVVTGLVARPFELTHDELLALPQDELTADLHCVTGWSHLATSFRGLPLATLLDRARPRSAARFVRLVAYSDRGHDTSLPLDLARADTWLVHTRDGQPLTPEHGYPLRAVTPSRYFYKSLKWVHRVELLQEDRLGYWERVSAYHNNGDPWIGDERFVTGSVDPAALARLRNAASLDPHRGPRKVKVGLDLRGWDPRDRDLHDLHLKLCDLREARLAGVDLHDANLSLCDLRGADLEGANLAGADLEGANFAGANLARADLSRSALSATRFFERRPDGQIDGARVAGLRRDDATGLLEDQEAYLEGA